MSNIISKFLTYQECLIFEFEKHKNDQFSNDNINEQPTFDNLVFKESLFLNNKIESKLFVG